MTDNKRRRNEEDGRELNGGGGSKEEHPKIIASLSAKKNVIPHKPSTHSSLAVGQSIDSEKSQCKYLASLAQKTGKIVKRGMSAAKQEKPQISQVPT